MLVLRNSISLFLLPYGNFETKRLCCKPLHAQNNVAPEHFPPPPPTHFYTIFFVVEYGVSNYCLTFVCTFQIYKRLVTVFDQIAWRRFLIDMTWRVVLQFSRLFGQPPTLSSCFTTQNSNGSDHLSAKTNHNVFLKSNYQETNFENKRQWQKWNHV